MVISSSISLEKIKDAQKDDIVGTTKSARDSRSGRRKPITQNRIRTRILSDRNALADGRGFRTAEPSLYPTPHTAPATGAEIITSPENSRYGEKGAAIKRRILGPDPASVQAPRPKPSRLRIQNSLNKSFIFEPNSPAPSFFRGVGRFFYFFPFFFNAASITARSLHGTLFPPAIWIQSSLPFPVPMTTSPSFASAAAFSIASARSKIL